MYTFRETPGANSHLDITVDHEYVTNDDRAPPSTDSTRTQTARYRFLYDDLGRIRRNHPKQDYIFVKEKNKNRFAPGYGDAMADLTDREVNRFSSNPRIDAATVIRKFTIRFNPRFKDVAMESFLELAGVKSQGTRSPQQAGQ